jgi:hypothetical protein
MECCLNNLGKYPHNKEINTNITAPATGDYVFYFTTSNSNNFSLTINFEVGDKLIIPVSTLNESMVHTFRIEKPDGNFITQNECDVFGLQTIINTQIDGCSNSCDDTDTTTDYGY